MTKTTNRAERRQFGRRPLNADAVAELPGPIEIPCVIENLSEGGALLSFPTGVAPIDAFDLTIEDVAFRIPCEMRYQVGISFGVRFKRQDHGEALVLHFFRSTAPPAPTNNNQSRVPDRSAPPRRSIRQLRATMLPIIATEATRTTDRSASAAPVLPACDQTAPPTSKSAAAEPTETARPSLQTPPLSSRLARLIAKR